MHSKYLVYLLSCVLLVNEEVASSQGDQVNPSRTTNSSSNGTNLGQQNNSGQNQFTKAQRAQVSAFGVQNENSSQQRQSNTNAQRTTNNGLRSQNGLIASPQPFRQESRDSRNNQQQNGTMGGSQNQGMRPQQNGTMGGSQNQGMGPQQNGTMGGSQNQGMGSQQNGTMGGSQNQGMGSLIFSTQNGEKIDGKAKMQNGVLNLPNSQLTGTIPQEIGALPDLNQIDLSGNYLTSFDGSAFTSNARRVIKLKLYNNPMKEWKNIKSIGQDFEAGVCFELHRSASTPSIQFDGSVFQSEGDFNRFHDLFQINVYSPRSDLTIGFYDDPKYPISSFLQSYGVNSKTMIVKHPPIQGKPPCRIEVINLTAGYDANRLIKILEGVRDGVSSPQ